MTHKVETLELKAFRSVTNLALENLRPVTLIVGANNAGKSTMLEATALALRPSDPMQWVQVARHRDVDMPLIDGLWSLFPGGSVMRLEDDPQYSKEMHIELGLHEGMRRKLQARCFAAEGLDSSLETQAVLNVELSIDDLSRQTMVITPAGLVGRIGPARVEGQAHKVFTVTPATHRSTKAIVEHLSRVVDEGKKHIAVEVLRLFDENVEDLDVIASLGREAVRVTHKGRGVVDLSSFGDGMRRATVLALTLVRASRGVLLIDEIEAGIHHTLHAKVFDKLFGAARDMAVQILATTHSLEAVDATLECMGNADHANEFCSFWLSRDGARHEARRYDFDKLSVLREGGLDIR